MSENIHPLSAKVLDSIDEFNADGAVSLILDQFSSDAVFVAPGHSAVAGTYRAATESGSSSSGSSGFPAGR